MLKFFKGLLEPIQNMDGSLSGRRVAGFILIGFGLAGWLLRLSDTVSTLIIGFGGILIGVTTADPHPPAGPVEPERPIDPSENHQG